MPSKNELPDLKHLCSQVFSGVGYTHSEEIIASRRTLLFQEAVKILHLAGFEGKELESEMGVLEKLIENHLSTDGNTNTNEAKVKSQKNANESNSTTEPDRTWTDFTYSDGAHYTGQILDGEPNGKGTLSWPSGNEYKGEFLDGEPHGEGALTRPSGSAYSGGWCKGKFNGFGKHILHDGTIIEGQYIDGKLHGYASQVSSDGSSYKGEWENNGRHGHGVFTNKKGKIQSGRFVNGQYSPRRSAKWTSFKKVGMACVFLIVLFFGYSFNQSLYSGVSFFHVIEDRRDQIIEYVNLERYTEVSLGTGSGVAMEDIGDMKLYEEDIAVLDSANSGDLDAQVEFAKILYRSNTKEALDRASDWLQKAASKGNAKAWEELGMMYFTGALGQKDLARAYAALSLAEMTGEYVNKASFNRLLTEMNEQEISQAQIFIQSCITQGFKNCSF